MSDEEIPGDDVPDYSEGDEDRQEYLQDSRHVDIEDVPDEDDIIPDQIDDDIEGAAPV